MSMTMEVKERGIAFTAPMLLAIRRGAKTQTRRHIKPDWWRCLNPEEDREAALANSPFQPGQTLWIKEATYRDERGFARYAVDDEPVFNRLLPIEWRWKPPKLAAMYCPRLVSRSCLVVTDRRYERVDEIDWIGAMAEGVMIPDEVNKSDPASDPWLCDAGCKAYVDGYAKLWDSINGKTYPWASSPWVWVVEFKRIP